MTELRTPGIRANLSQFFLQVLLVFFVGVTVGLERNIVPILAKEEFHVGSFSVLFSFIVSFGIVKALLNLSSGAWSERWGRKPFLILGWIAAIPVPLMIIWAESWLWVTIANIFLGINQGLTWTMTQTSKLDMAGGREMGIAASLDEWGGYFGVAVATIVTGYLAAVFGIRPVPFYFGLAVIVVALLVSIVFVKETLPYTYISPASGTSGFGFLSVVKQVSWKDKSMFACSQAGLIEKFVDVMVWVAFPLFFFGSLNVDRIGVVVGAYGLSWGFLQLLVGPVSDRIGRKWLIVAGMWICGLGILLTAIGSGFYFWMLTSAITGIGMALLYPTLIAAIGDFSHPAWRASALGVYRMWRDSGYALGALVISMSMDIFGVTSSFYITACLMIVSGAVVAGTMRD
ncbi:arabinose efflux permease family protein [Candidatus Methanoperedens nitroreducens]|uniref:Arabinose efflux permease family protein n=1 Tax=Candidatus Methanoperedens nitratireducens TaxID=1392998 RepID=A0A062V0Y3_9EURY|nr:MFS transporter [Candidatus Methanoperedens nitroreducens]KCZ71037.1 arabinose efflux permease family protein [Candidatus Methanoperedens nitroreducens]MDJ1421589.1 MFS transporter [Candidatus Methanoperedens sp.]